MKMTTTKKSTFLAMITLFVAGGAALWLGTATQNADWLKTAMAAFATGNLLGILGVRMKGV